MTTAVARRDQRQQQRPQQAQTNGLQLADTRTVQRALQESDRRAGIVALLGDTVSIERFEQVVLQAVNRNPDLQKASLASLLDSVRVAATLRLEPTGILGEGYLIRYGDDAQFEAGYRGLMKLARRSGQVTALDAQVVYANDAFALSLGTDPRIEHVPARTDRGAYLGAYAWARLTSGELVIEWMPTAEIEAVRRVSRNGTGARSPWVNHWGEMARKTVTKRLSKRLPLGLDAEAVLQHEALADEAASQPAPRRSAAVAEIHARLGIPTTSAAIGSGEPVEADQGEQDPPSPAVPTPGAEPAPDADPGPADGAGDAPPDDIVDGAVAEVCGDPSPYGDGLHCILEPSHPDRLACSSGKGTWKRGAARQ